MESHTTKLEERVLDAVDVEGLIGFLGELVAVPSVANEETAAQELVAARMEAVGLDVDVWPIDFEALSRHPAYAADVERSEGLGVVGSSPQELAHGSTHVSADEAARGLTLILNGHVDVVPAGEVDRWTYPPFALTCREGRLYGRGVVDMKGALAAALFAAQALRDVGVTLRGRLQIQSVIGEEDGGAGTLATLERGHTGDAAIVMEPTSFVLAPAQAGALSFQLTVPGKAAHGALREEGVDPVEKFIPVFHELRKLEARRNAPPVDPLFQGEVLPYALTMGRLRAGIWPSTVAETLVVEGRYGVAPGEDPADARAELERAVADAARADAWLRQNPPVVEWRGAQFEAARTDPDHPIVRAVSNAQRSVTGRIPPLGGMRFGADMRLLVNQGGIPTVLYGPGDVREAHRPDESVSVEDLATAARILALTAMRFCGVVGADPPGGGVPRLGEDGDSGRGPREPGA